MTPEDARLLADLDAAEAQVSAAPWFAHENDLIGGWCVMGEDKPPSESHADVADFTSPNEATFIAAARNALPRLLALVREQEAVYVEMERNARIAGWSEGINCPPWAFVASVAAKAREQDAALSALVSTCETDGGYTVAREREMLADLGDEISDKQPWKALREARRVLGKESKP